MDHRCVNGGPGGAWGSHSPQTSHIWVKETLIVTPVCCTNFTLYRCQDGKKVEVPIQVNIITLPIFLLCSQWYDALKAVARLSTGIPKEWRRKVRRVCRAKI